MTGGLRIGILISGSGSNMVALVRAMQTGDVAATPALVLSNRPQAPGLGKARDLNVPTQTVPHAQYQTRETFEAALDEALTAARIDLVCCAGFMRILTPGFVSRWEGRMLNIHPSLLPKYPGLDTHARALAAGDSRAGCTVHEVTAELDAGPILGQASVPIAPGDTPQTLAARVLIQEHRLYPAVLARVVAGNREMLVL
ncbi:MAG: phosphoribosylglycinamide formyltransferase [Pseudomonadota bacterium]